MCSLPKIFAGRTPKQFQRGYFDNNVFKAFPEIVNKELKPIKIFRERSKNKENV